MEKTSQEPSIKEKIAFQIHELWSHWMKYLDSKAFKTKENVIFSGEEWHRWMILSNYDFDHLSPLERKSDMELTYLFLPFFEHITAWVQDLDDFLVHWLWNDKGSIPSQDLAILLEWREKFEEIRK